MLSLIILVYDQIACCKLHEMFAFGFTNFNYSDLLELYCPVLCWYGFPQGSCWQEPMETWDILKELALFLHFGYRLQSNCHFVPKLAIDCSRMAPAFKITARVLSRIGYIHLHICENFMYLYLNQSWALKIITTASISCLVQLQFV